MFLRFLSPARLFSWLEKRLALFPQQEISPAPANFCGFCRYFIAGAWRWLALMALFTALVSGLEISLFSFLGHIVDWLSSCAKQDFFAQKGASLCLLAVIIVLILPLLVMGQNLTTYQILLPNLPMRIRWLLARYLLGQSLSYFNEESSGRLASQLMQSAIALREVVMKFFNVLNYVLVSFLGTLWLAGRADWHFLLPFLSWLGLYFLLLYYFIPKLQQASQLHAEANSRISGRLVDIYSNISLIKLFGRLDREESYIKDGFIDFQNSLYRQMRLISQFSLAIYISNSLLLFFVGALGLFLWQKGRLAISAIAMALGLALRLNSMAQWIMWEMSALFENIGIVKGNIASFSKEAKIKDHAKAGDLHLSKGEIIFENVSFAYGPANAGLQNIDLHIKGGEKIGIVGASGAGKSTLLNLLLRFYDVTSGRILLDGQDIAQVKQESLRSQISTVAQDNALLHRSLRDNLLYGAPFASDEELLAALKQAQAYDFCQNLCDKHGNKMLDAMIGERGASLSGGQRQRIAIARALLKKAPILILDEATSALDSKAEFAIQQNLDALMQGKTVLAIAHRLSTLAKMDRIIVMEGGQIIEQGAPQELLAQNGAYARLWYQQMSASLQDDQQEAGIKAQIISGVRAA